MSKILVIEDNQHMRELIKRILETKDYTVIEASDGETGLKSVDLNNPEIVILDLMMPGLGGIAVLEKTSQDQIGPRSMSSS